MLKYIIAFFILVVLNEGLTELIAKSGFFSFFRNIIFVRADKNRVYRFFTMVLSCAYCTSVWTSLLFVVPFVYIVVGYFYTFSFYWLLFVLPFVVIVHRMSNYLHDFTDRYIVRNK